MLGSQTEQGQPTPPCQMVYRKCLHLFSRFLFLKLVASFWLCNQKDRKDPSSDETLALKHLSASQFKVKVRPVWQRKAPGRGRVGAGPTSVISASLALQKSLGTDMYTLLHLKRITNKDLL